MNKFFEKELKKRQYTNTPTFFKKLTLPLSLRYLLDDDRLAAEIFNMFPNEYFLFKN